MRELGSKGAFSAELAVDSSNIVQLVHDSYNVSFILLSSHNYNYICYNIQFEANWQFSHVSAGWSPNMIHNHQNELMYY